MPSHASREKRKQMSLARALGRREGAPFSAAIRRFSSTPRKSRLPLCRATETTFFLRPASHCFRKYSTSASSGMAWILLGIGGRESRSVAQEREHVGHLLQADG